MREIKFRAWLKGVMHPIWYQIDPEVNKKHHKGIVIMQWTGLKDKNGKDIYEKDVVLGKFVLDDVEDYIYLSLKEKEKKTQSKNFLINDIFYIHVNPIPDDIEVIGNIYENPELLKTL